MDYKEEHCWHDFNTAELRRDRARLRDIVLFVYGWIGALCLFFLFAIAATWPTNANSEEIPVHVSEQQGIVVRLMPGPCVDQRSQFMILNGLPQYATRFRAIDSEWPMKDGTRKKFAGCWALLSAEEAGAPEEVFILVFEDGAAGGVPKSEFLKKPGQPGA